MVADLDSFASIPAAFFSIANSKPQDIVYTQAQAGTQADTGTREWKATNYSECVSRVKKISVFLQGLGIKKGESVAILSQSRPEWMEADIAILALGGISVSVYQSLPADDVGYILFDSNASVVFAENQEQVDKLLWLKDNEITIVATEERAEQKATVSVRKVISFESVDSDDLVVELASVLEGSADFDESSFAGLTREDLAALVYTSGTTGPPKGVMQTHGNHLSNCRQAWNANLLEDKSSIMVFLPLAHAFAKLMGYLGFLSEGTLKFPSIADSKSSRLDPNVITRDIREGSANVVPIVPRLLEKMQAGISARANGSGLQAKIVKATLFGAREMYQARKEGRSAPVLAQIAYHGTAGIRQKIKNQLFGPDFVYAISGGAKMNPTVGRFFDMLDIEICEGYGLTETCVATNVNRPGQKRIGSVGPVLDSDIELRIGDDDEIMFRGPNVALGYYGRETATKESWDSEGWFHTGDLGALDDEGYLSIVGRKKEILVTSYGKNIAPEDIEGALKNSPYISQAVMVGDGRPYCVCVVTLDAEALKVWSKKTNTALSDTPSEDEKVKDLIWSEVEKVNEELAKHETMKKVIILPEDFSIDNGFLTPTFKVKKRLVLQEFAEKIEAAYA